MTDDNKQKNISLKEIDEMVYGRRGLLDRVKIEIMKIGAAETGKRSGVSTQNIHIFLDTARPKIETIKRYAEVVGME